MIERVTITLSNLDRSIDEASLVIGEVLFGVAAKVNRGFRGRLLNRMVDDAERLGVDDTKDLGILLRFISTKNRDLLRERIGLVLEGKHLGLSKESQD